VDRIKTVEKIQELVTNYDRLDGLKHGNYESKKEILMQGLVPIERMLKTLIKFLKNKPLNPRTLGSLDPLLQLNWRRTLKVGFKKEIIASK
jgi:hypothetical protein